MDKFDRYLKVCEWARKRYTSQGSLTVSIGGKPTTYSRIENLAAVKILGCNDHWKE